jgi:hypothetical protein
LQWRGEGVEEKGWIGNDCASEYSQLSWQQRLGNLASTLARAATAASNPRTAASVPDLLREGIWVIEWSKDDSPLETLVELAPMQRELGLLRRAWEQDNQVARPLMALRARAMSDRVLELSRLASGRA